jgi:nucleoside 2-deoxyribosyltransferase
MDQEGIQMKIYFACSVRGGRDDKDTYQDLLRFLSKRGEVLTQSNADLGLTAFGHPGDTGEIQKQRINLLESCDVVIAEVTTPSLGVGYEIAKAEDINKPVLALYRPQPGRNLSAMIGGSPDIIVAPYSEIYQAKQAIDEFLEKLS